MSNIFIAFCISIIFLIVKFFEMRFIEKENKPLKFLLRDTILVYFSVLFGNFILDQISPVINLNSKIDTPVFTDNPTF
jgi:hypothetical protein